MNIYYSTYLIVYKQPHRPMGGGAGGHNVNMALARCEVVV